MSARYPQQFPLPLKRRGLKIGDAVHYCGVDAEILTKMKAAGELAYVKVTATLEIFLKEDLDRMLDDRREVCK